MTFSFSTFHIFRPFALKLALLDQNECEFCHFLIIGFGTGGTRGSGISCTGPCTVGGGRWIILDRIDATTRVKGNSLFCILLLHRSSVRLDSRCGRLCTSFVLCTVIGPRWLCLRTSGLALEAWFATLFYSSRKGFSAQHFAQSMVASILFVL